MQPVDIDERTRRSILRALGASLGAAGVGAAASGTAAAHPDDTDGPKHEGHDHTNPDLHESTAAETVGYHSLGGVGSASWAGEPEEPHYGGITELRVNGERGLAFVGIFSSRAPTEDRGLAILDVSDYIRARSADELDTAEPVVLSFVRNDNPAAAVMDVKVSDDGNYAFLSKQPFAASPVGFDDPGARPNSKNHSFDPSASAIKAVDVTDPGNPEVVGSYDAWGIGPHNAYYHQINGTEYVFGVEYDPEATGLVVLEFDRSTGQLRPVNYWQADDSHDFTAVDDPLTGRPLGYFAGWGAGMIVLDLSDPTNLVEIGRFDMARSHYVQPAPVCINGKRLAMAGQETPSQNEGPSGYLYLVDCDPLDAAIENGTVADLNHRDGKNGSLDSWTWAENVSFSNYFLGPHNGDITKEGWIHLGHYHAGTQFFRITDDFELEYHGSHKGGKDVPEESRMQDLKKVLPFYWSSVEQNGLTFSADINAGVYVAEHDDIPVGTDVPVDIRAEHRDAASAFTAGQTVRMTVDVDAELLPEDSGERLYVRDRLPASWTVYDDGDAHTVSQISDQRQVVEFTVPVGEAADDTGTDTERAGTRTYYAQAPDQTGSYAFGPIEYTTDDASLPDWRRVWTKRNGAVETNGVVGASTDF